MESTGIRTASGRDYGTGLVLFGLLGLLVGILFLAKAVLFLLLSIPGVTPPVAGAASAAGNGSSLGALNRGASGVHRPLDI